MGQYRIKIHKNEERREKDHGKSKDKVGNLLDAPILEKSVSPIFGLHKLIDERRKSQTPRTRGKAIGTAV